MNILAEKHTVLLNYIRFKFIIYNNIREHLTEYLSKVRSKIIYLNLLILLNNLESFNQLLLIIKVRICLIHKTDIINYLDE